LTDDPDLTDQVISNFRNAAISARAMGLLEFADKLTRASASMTEEDVEVLRGLGLSEEDVLDLVQLVSYFNYTNRVAVALGVDPETPDSERGATGNGRSSRATR
jgi:uncharacterized peroxidase-related enzyme